MELQELAQIRMKLVLGNALPDVPVPQYWEDEVPPSVHTAGDFADALGRISEDEAMDMLEEFVGQKVKTRWGVDVPVLAIITSEPWEDWVDSDGEQQPGAKHRFDATIGGSLDRRRPSFNRYAAVESVELREVPKLIKFENGTIKEVSVHEVVAWGEPYDEGLRDHCSSSSERFELNGNDVVQHGAATALLARLLELATNS